MCLHSWELQKRVKERDVGNEGIILHSTGKKWQAISMSTTETGISFAVVVVVLIVLSRFMCDMVAYGVGLA